MRFDEFYEELEYFFGDEIEGEDAEVAFKIAKDQGVSILSDKDIYVIVKQDDEVVGALWTAWNSEEFSFDVVINKKYQGQGMGKKLVDTAISTFNEDKEAYGDDAIMKIDVINPKMERMLLSKGFEIENNFPGHTIMIRN